MADMLCALIADVVLCSEACVIFSHDKNEKKYKNCIDGKGGSLTLSFVTCVGQ